MNLCGKRGSTQLTDFIIAESIWQYASNSQSPVPICTFAAKSPRNVRALLRSEAVKAKLPIGTSLLANYCPMFTAYLWFRSLRVATLDNIV